MNPAHAPERRRRSRWSIPIALGLVLLGCLPFIAVFTMGGGDSGVELPLSEEDRRSLSGGLKMLSPNFSGRTKDGEPYTVSAKWALPNGPRPSLVTLDQLKATLAMQDGREAVMTADRGRYYPNEERLILDQTVRAQLSDGYVLETPAVSINIAERILQGTEGIQASGPQGSIQSDTVEARENMDGMGRIVIFRGNVQLIFRPQVDAIAVGNREQD